MNIGFIGLGIMGKPMAGHLLQAGYKLHIYNRSTQAVQELAARGAVACKSSKEVAERSDVIITMLPDSPEVEEVVLGPNGVLEGVARSAIVIDMSSINPMTSKKLAARLEEKGAHLIDAPVSGGEIGAIEAKLAIMVGGSEELVERVRPILAVMGATITRVGEVGAGNTVKLINQMMVAIHLAALSEGMAFGRKAGIDPAAAYEAIRGGLAGSRVMETKIQNVVQEAFKPGFRIELHAKDLRNAAAMGEEVDAQLTFTRPLLEMLERLIEQGYGKEDHSALYRLFN